ncbi:MAG: RcnB family protein [Sphingobium sp.]|uniref:RcnB family protein n=1 Tax=Sphingobium sp. TaxID=1912891 RepID=UPI0029B9197D|nr:RcnB family protein [Sphingobium sp.]MDX3909398.1 RcnB family protein [Sphingobium sp.]
MKKFLMALAATTMIASPLVTAQAQAAPHRDRFEQTTVKHKANGRTVIRQRQVIRQNDNRNYGYNAGYNDRRWAKGQRFDRRQANNYRVIGDYRSYRLNTPPRGYQWVRSGNDAVMIAITSGIIGAVIGNAIR